MRVVITEKPSVARDLAKVLGATTRRDGWLEGDGLRITWCLGHLVELEEPDHYDTAWRRWSLDTLPMLPDAFHLRVRADAADRFEVVKRILRQEDVHDVVNACDAGREGELIFRYVYELAACARPVQRLWLASLTPRAIREAWGKLRPGPRFDALADAARCRSEADWLVGMNATRAMTCLARQAGDAPTLSIGRVQTPTLAMVVERDLAIEAFVPEDTWQVRGTFRAEVEGTVAEWVGTWFRPSTGAESREREDEAPSAERLPTGEAARALADAIVGQPGTVEQSETKRITDRPPFLYDLTSLQRRANQRYGLSAQRTLDIAQALYERHKLITYPRTDARHLTSDQVPELPGLVQGLAELSVYAPHAAVVLQRFDEGFVPSRRVVDDGEVGDHHAILPTGRRADRAGLDPDEKRVYDLVARRFLAALSPDALFDRTVLIVAVDAPVPEGLDAPPRFRARARVCVQEGWRLVDPPRKSKELELPRIPPGSTTTTAESEVVEGQTRPPRPYDDASLLKAMETAGKDLDDAALRRAMRGAGLGTPATRAAILQTLLTRGYVRRDKRHLRATERGTALIGAIPVEVLKSPELTGSWEKRLSDIADGAGARDAFMRDVASLVAEAVGAIAAAEAPTGPAFTVPRQAGERVGTCPRCQGDVVERRAVFACDGCELVVFKTMSGRKVSKRQVQDLLREGRSKPVKGFKSRRTGKAFTAGLELREDGSVGLWFPEAPVLADCPRCSAPIRDRGRVWSCTGEDCPVHVFKEISGKKLEEDVVKVLLTEGRTPVLEGFVSRRTGKTFDAALVLSEEGKATFDFGERARPAGPAEGPPPMDIEADPAGMTCPACGEGQLLRGRTAWGCSRWREGCRWTLPYAEVADAAEAVARVKAATE